MRKYDTFEVLDAAGTVIATFKGEPGLRKAMFYMTKRIKSDASIRGWNTTDQLRRIKPDGTTKLFDGVTALNGMDYGGTRSSW